MKSHSNKELQAEFKAIREQFFPRWRTGGRWILKEGFRAQYRSSATGLIRNTNEDGYCETWFVFISRTANSRSAKMTGSALR
jgi:hypothetical protein